MLELLVQRQVGKTSLNPLTYENTDSTVIGSQDGRFCSQSGTLEHTVAWWCGRDDAWRFGRVMPTFNYSEQVE